MTTAPYQRFVLQTGTGLHPAHKEFVFAVAANRDLFAIKKYNTGGTTEIHVLSAQSGYQQFSLQTGTALHPTGDDFAFAVAENRDVFAIKKYNTGSGTTEVHVLSAASGYQQFSLQTGTALHPTGDDFEFALAENRDLIAIKKYNTGSGTTEVHVLSAENGYQQFSLQTGTALHPAGNDFEFALAENRDLIAIKKQNTGGTTEVHVLSAKSGYQQFSLQTGTALHPTREDFAFVVAENRDVFAIKKYNTGSSTTEIHILESGKPKLAMDKLRALAFKSTYRAVSFEKNSAPLDYHSIAGHRWQHLQDMIRLPDAGGRQYYMGTYSQNCADDEGGLVFVGELINGDSGQVIWHDELNNRHLAGGFNHPGDIRRIGNIVVIAGQNWDGGSLSLNSSDEFWRTLGSKIGQEFADKMARGNGGQAILFYDVSVPNRPVYLGKLNSYLNGRAKVPVGEIDQVTAAQSGDYYYLAFNGARCRSPTFTPVGPWERIQEGSDDSPSPVRYWFQGRDVVGGASLSDDKSAVVLDEIRFLPGPSELNANTRQVERHPATSVSIPVHSLPDGATFSLSTMPDGSASIVIANVESDSRIEILELRSEPG